LLVAGLGACAGAATRRDPHDTFVLLQREEARLARSLAALETAPCGDDASATPEADEACDAARAICDVAPRDADARARCERARRQCEDARDARTARCPDEARRGGVGP
jgi:hypothetical protein